MRIVVTGAFSNIGSAVAREFLTAGHDVHTLTNRTPPPASREITCAPLRFEPAHLVGQLSGADVFVTTYWIRLPHAGQTFRTAVNNCKVLVDAAAKAGVRRFVQVSVSNADAGRNLGYYRGKSDVEAYVRASGLSHAIVCPTLVVGPADVLSSNIAWFLRRFPIFPIPGGGHYRLQPITLDDTARVIARAAGETDCVHIDAAGPDVMTFAEYVELVAAALGVRRLVFGAPGWLSLAAIRLVEAVVRDVILTKEELLGLQQELLLSKEPATGSESVSDWLMTNAEKLGTRYVNDIDRHFGKRRTEPVLTP